MKINLNFRAILSDRMASPLSALLQQGGNPANGAYERLQLV
jgi:hypothetical protein